MKVVFNHLTVSRYIPLRLDFHSNRTLGYPNTKSDFCMLFLLRISYGRLWQPPDTSYSFERQFCVLVWRSSSISKDAS